MCNMVDCDGRSDNSTTQKKFGLGWWGHVDYVNVDVDFSYSLSLFS